MRISNPDSVLPNVERPSPIDKAKGPEILINDVVVPVPSGSPTLSHEFQNALTA